MMKVIITRSEQVRSVFLAETEKHREDYLVVVLFTKPSQMLRETLKGTKINNMFFIDAVEPTNEENTISVAPNDLTSLSIIISESLQLTTETKKVLLFDSIDAITIHNKPTSVGKFLNFIIEQSHTWNVNLTLIATKETDPRILTVVKQSVDIIRYI